MRLHRIIADTVRGPMSPRTMHAAIWRTRGVPMAVEEVTLRELGPRDVLLKVTAANACVTDSIVLAPEVPAMFDNVAPQIFGHGAVGIIEEVGPHVTVTAPGDRVIASANPLCRTCYYCLRGRPDQCADIVLHGPANGRLGDGQDVVPNGNIGGYAEYAIVPDNQITPVQTSVPDDELALLADGIGGGLGAAFNVAPVLVGSEVAVFGCGATGLGYVQAARIARARRIIAVDPIAERREMALRLGATDAIDPAQGDVIAQVQELTDDVGGFIPRGVDFAYEASADARGMEHAWHATRSAGHVVLASMPWKLDDVITLPSVPAAIFGKTLHSSQWGHINILRDLPRYIRLIEDGEVQIAPLISGHFDLGELDRVLHEQVANHRVYGAIMTPAG
jgi:S-(hydroxymethyl)glutathione dehydrogenase/alcohol dehydrogenase